MTNKTFIPAFKAKVGDWPYYICMMKYAQVSREVQFAHELGGNRDLNTLIQRGLSKRTDGIREYLLQSQHRFLGALIVATWGGDPDFITLQMDDPEGYLSGIDNGFGVLTLDGTHQFFALDGQHRLKAIKEAIKTRPELGAEDICVLLVSHYDTAQGRERTQRLFTNINRNAKTTTQAENIALDVDDGYAVTTRELLTKHPFLSQDGRVRIFQSAPSGEGAFKLAGNSVPVADKRAWTTITVMYDLVKELGFGLDPAMENLSVRPSDQILGNSYVKLSERLDELLQHCGDLRSRLEAASNAKDIRVPSPTPSLGHPFMRPVVQKAVVRAARHIVQQGSLTWPAFLTRLQGLTWELGAAPWTAVFNTANNKMITATENQDLLFKLLLVHLAPMTKAEVSRARREYRQVRGVNYPVVEDVLAGNVVEEKATQEAAPASGAESGT